MRLCGGSSHLRRNPGERIGQRAPNILDILVVERWLITNAVRSVPDGRILGAWRIPGGLSPRYGHGRKGTWKWVSYRGSVDA
jgi:hypothetical protein